MRLTAKYAFKDHIKLICSGRTATKSVLTNILDFRNKYIHHAHRMHREILKLIMTQT